MYTQNGMEVYTEEELGGVWDEIKGIFGAGLQQKYGGAIQPQQPSATPVAPAPRSFMDKYGMYLLIGGGVLAVLLIMRKKK